MDDRLLEIRRYEGGGYRPLIDFASWRVAILRWDPSMEPDQIAFMERHTKTDEVFVLLKGKAKLILGGNSTSVEELYAQELEAFSLYNVKQNAWHTVILSKDATILIVEESNTGKTNTEYCNMSMKLKQAIMDVNNNG
jgi:ureidoglycolate hydrolase